MRKRLLSMLLVLAMAISLLPTAAFAAEPGTAIATQESKQIDKKGGTYVYYDAKGDAIADCTDSDSGWVVKTMRKLEATGTENLFNVTMELAVKEETAEIKSKKAAVTIVLDTSNSMNRCLVCGKQHSASNTYDHPAQTRIAAANSAIASFLDDYAKNGDNFYGDRWISFVTFNSDIAKIDMDSENEGAQYWVNIEDQDSLDMVKKAVTVKRCINSTNTDGAMDAAAELLDDTAEGAPIADILADNRFCILLTDGVPTSRFDENGNYTNGGNGDTTQLAESFQAQQACWDVKEGARGGLYSVAYCFDGESVPAVKTDDPDGLKGVQTKVPVLQWLGINEDDSKNEDYCASTCVYAASAAEELNKALKAIIIDIQKVGGNVNSVTASIKSSSIQLASYDFIKFLNQNGAQEIDNKITWDLSVANAKKENGISTYTMSYQIRMNTQEPDFRENQEYYLGKAVLEYTPNGSTTSATAAFEDLSAHGYRGSLSFEKVSLPEMAPLANALFDMINKANVEVCMDAERFGMVEVSDENGKVNFDNVIPSGYSYVLTEMAAPEGYDADESFREEITVAYGETTGLDANTQVGNKRSAVKVLVTADVEKFHNEIQPHEKREREVNEIYEYDEIENYECDKTEIYGREAQNYLVPVFAKKVNSVNDTLVTRLTYSDNTNKATALNGGAFKNGHTYVAVNVAEASAEGGVWYTIADSSKAGGKKTPDQYNIPIDAQYNVRIKDGKLFISFDDSVVSASVGAYVVKDPGKDGKNFPSNAPAHFENGVTVDLPKGCGDTVYLYTHISALDWCDSDAAYEFVEWRYNNTVYGEEYKLIDTKYGDYVLVSTTTGNETFSCVQYGDYETVAAWDDAPVKVADTYEGGLTLKVNGEVKPLGEAFELAAGEYEFTLSSNADAFEPITKKVTIVAGEDVSVDFGTITIRTEDVRLEADVQKADRAAEKSYVYRSTVANYSEGEALKAYTEEYTYLEDIQLGDASDPFGEYAVRLN